MYGQAQGKGEGKLLCCGCDGLASWQPQDSKGCSRNVEPGFGCNQKWIWHSIVWRGGGRWTARREHSESTARARPEPPINQALTLLFGGQRPLVADPQRPALSRSWPPSRCPPRRPAPPAEAVCHLVCSRGDNVSLTDGARRAEPGRLLSLSTEVQLLGRPVCLVGVGEGEN